MDIRDLDVWAREAKRGRLARRMEAFTAALLPHQDSATIESVMGGLREEMETIDQDMDEIEKAEMENARLIAEANQMMKERRERRRAQRAAGIAPAVRKKRRLPKKGKVIR